MTNTCAKGRRTHRDGQKCFVSTGARSERQDTLDPSNLKQDTLTTLALPPVKWCRQVNLQMIAAMVLLTGNMGHAIHSPLICCQRARATTRFVLWGPPMLWTHLRTASQRTHTHVYNPNNVPRTIHTSIHTYMHAYMHAYIHTYIYMHIHIHIQTHTHIHIHTHTYIHTNIHTYIHTDTHTDIRTYIHTDRQTDVRTYIHIHIYTYIHTYTHTYTHTYIHTYTHTYIHTYIRPRHYYHITANRAAAPSPSQSFFCTTYLTHKTPQQPTATPRSRRDVADDNNKEAGLSDRDRCFGGGLEQICQSNLTPERCCSSSDCFFFSLTSNAVGLCDGP